MYTNLVGALAESYSVGLDDLSTEEYSVCEALANFHNSCVEHGTNHALVAMLQTFLAEVSK